MDWNKRWKKQMVLNFHYTGGRDARGLVERKGGGERSKHRQDGVHLQDLPKCKICPRDRMGGISLQRDQRWVWKKGLEKWELSIEEVGCSWSWGATQGFLRPDVTWRNICKGFILQWVWDIWEQTRFKLEILVRGQDFLISVFPVPLLIFNFSAIFKYHLYHYLLNIFL